MAVAGAVSLQMLSVQPIFQDILKQERIEKEIEREDISYFFLNGQARWVSSRRCALW